MGIDLGSLSWREMELGHPWLLLIAIPGLLLILWRHRRGGGKPALVYPSVRGLKGLPRTTRQRLAFLVPVLESGGLVLLGGAVARPRQGDSTTEVRKEGLAIQMVLDVSGSMEERMQYEGAERRRIDIVREAFRRFVSGDRENGGSLEGRKSDFIGLTTFDVVTEVSCPLVADHAQLLSAVADLEPSPFVKDKEGRPIPNDQLPASNDRAGWQRFEKRYGPLSYHRGHRTAIGDGLMRAVLSLITAEKDLAQGREDESYKIKGKVIVLLTDGEDNASDRSPVDAGKSAEANGIRVYYVCFRERVERQRGRIVAERSPDEILEEPRKVTGDPSRAFLAEDGDALTRIYEEIDRLERTEIGKIEYRSYNELFNLLLVPGFAFTLLALLLGETLFRRTP